MIKIMRVWKYQLIYLTGLSLIGENFENTKLYAIDVGAVDLTSSNFNGSDIRLIFKKNAQLENITISEYTIKDYCFSDDLLNRAL